MINIGKVKSYCCEDISLIENYGLAIADNTQTWHCHHRLEIDLNKSKQQLIDDNLYYNRPAPELIFLTEHDHKSMHGKIVVKSDNFLETMGSPEMKEKISIGTKAAMDKPEVKEKISIRTKAAMDKLEVKEKILGDNNVMKRPEVREKNRKSLLKYYETHSSPTKGKHRVYREDGSFYYDW